MNSNRLCGSIHFVAGLVMAHVPSGLAQNTRKARTRFKSNKKGRLAELFWGRRGDTLPADVLSTCYTHWLVRERD